MVSNHSVGSSTTTIKACWMTSEKIILNAENVLNRFLGKLRSVRVRRKPLFDIKLWSVHDRATQWLIRTNYSTGACHRRINSIFQCAHPSLWIFFQKLIDEENVIHVDLVQILNLLRSAHADLSLKTDSIVHTIKL